MTFIDSYLRINKLFVNIIFEHSTNYIYLYIRINGIPDGSPKDKSPTDRSPMDKNPKDRTPKRQKPLRQKPQVTKAPKTKTPKYLLNMF